MTLQLQRVDPATVEAALGFEVDLPAVAVLGTDEGAVVGSGGLAWGMGKAWIWFKMLESRPSYAVPIFRETQRMLRRAVQLGETEVFTPRDEDKPQSEKLLRMLGFEPTDEILRLDRDYLIWRWSAARG